MEEFIADLKLKLPPLGCMFSLIYSFSTSADFSCDETDKGLPVQMHSLREFEQVRMCSSMTSWLTTAAGMVSRTVIAG